MSMFYLILRLIKLNFRKGGRYQFMAEGFIYAAIPLDEYDNFEITFNDETKVITITLGEMVATIKCINYNHNVILPDGVKEQADNIGDLINVVREYYYVTRPNVIFALN